MKHCLVLHLGVGTGVRFSPLFLALFRPPPPPPKLLLENSLPSIFLFYIIDLSLVVDLFDLIGRNLRPLESMAEVLGGSAVFSPRGPRPVALSCQKRGPSFLGFPLSSPRPIGPLRSSWRFVIGTRRGRPVYGISSSSRVQVCRDFKIRSFLRCFAVY